MCFMYSGFCKIQFDQRIGLSMATVSKHPKSIIIIITMCVCVLSLLLIMKWYQITVMTEKGYWHLQSSHRIDFVWLFFSVKKCHVGAMLWSRYAYIFVQSAKNNNFDWQFDCQHRKCCRCRFGSMKNLDSIRQQWTNSLFNNRSMAPLSLFNNNNNNHNRYYIFYSWLQSDR